MWKKYGWFSGSLAVQVYVTLRDKCIPSVNNNIELMFRYHEENISKNLTALSNANLK